MKIKYRVEVPLYWSTEQEVDIFKLGFSEEEWDELSQEEKEEELVLYFKDKAEYIDHYENEATIFNYEEIEE